MIDKSAIPGTVHLVDLNHDIAARHAKGQDDIILIPTPSSDPEDPLNWAPRRKALSTVCLAVCETPVPFLISLLLNLSSYVLFVGMANSVVYSVLVPISEATNLSGKCFSGRSDIVDLSVPSRRPQFWNRLLLPSLWLGPSFLAALCIAIWKTLDVSYFGFG